MTKLPPGCRKETIDGKLHFITSSHNTKDRHHSKRPTPLSMDASQVTLAIRNTLGRQDHSDVFTWMIQETTEHEDIDEDFFAHNWGFILSIWEKFEQESDASTTALQIIISRLGSLPQAKDEFLYQDDADKDVSKWLIRLARGGSANLDALVTLLRAIK
eukprot:CAMPEP_0181329252 /NCGR_PEP_ID=MMETSP1101-20121128/23204_1 /TAXON_ID=46948 /ORGANISM="Rhodomonas abbreviata, Strain Caron Lab Isolate" /LENGTH=158 /DNA_ID=CAMNT_0023438303 /DNA_START=164 /DNA_END=637 /DNA_ORIENTATION=+